MDPSRGDVIEVSWWDILEDPIGDPDSAEPAFRRSIGLFWERRQTPRGVPVLVTTTTLDDEADGQNGFCVYPWGCVDHIRVLKRKRKYKPKKEPVKAQVKP